MTDQDTDDAIKRKQDPAEGARDVIERELERQKKTDKQAEDAKRSSGSLSSGAVPTSADATWK